MPNGLHCPALFAVTYHLIFSVKLAHDTVGEIVDLNPTGCQPVTGIGPIRTLSLHEDFYQVLGTAIGLAHANRSTFAGTARSGN